MTSPLDVLESYGAAFARADVSALAECFAFPLQVVSISDDVPSITTAQAAEWPDVLQRLLGAYERLGVATCKAVAVETFDPMSILTVVRVQWDLRRGDHELVYDFTAVYTLALVQGRFRIVAVAHDEQPKMRSALLGLTQGPAKTPSPRASERPRAGSA